MKRKWHHPEASETQTELKVWRSLGEYADTPRFKGWLDREFPQGAAEMKDEEDAGVSRRSFMRLMGASTALAGFGMAGCRRPEKNLLPYTKHAEWIIPGKALLYATSMPRPGGSTPVVVTTYEGRPTNLQGNSLHPAAGGSSGVDVFTTASVLGLYDPDRSSRLLNKGNAASAADFDNFMRRTKARLGSGEGLAILVGETISPTRDRALKKIQAKFSAAKLYRYEALSPGFSRSSSASSFGPGAHQIPQLDKADRIFSLDCDFLGADRPGGLQLAKAFSARRDAEKLSSGTNPEAGYEMNRLYVVEGNYSVTGGMADHRLPVAPSQVIHYAAALAKALGGIPCEVKGSSLNETQQKWIAEAAKDLAAKEGKSLVMVGERQPREVHDLVNAINAKLKSFGSTIKLVKSADPALEYGSLADLAEAASAGQVKTLVSLTESDPLYDAPIDLKWGEAQNKIANVIHLGMRPGATGRAAHWHVPVSHYLESWSDVRSGDGTYSIVQPMILPLYDTVSELGFLLGLLEAPKPAASTEGKEDAAVAEAAPAKSDTDLCFEEVRATFKTVCGDSGMDEKWNQCLRDGYLENSAYADAGVSEPKTDGLAEALTQYQPIPAPSAGNYEVVFATDSSVYDGRYINNGWLQESPDPVSKITWDNCAVVSPRTALTSLKAIDGDEDALKLVEVETHDETRLVEVDINGQKRLYPLVPIPGHPDNVLTVTVGYGQGDTTTVGRVGGNTGFNAYSQRSSKNNYFAGGAKVELSTLTGEINGQEVKGGVYPLAQTQEHYSLEGRALVREGTVADYSEKKDFAQNQGMDSHIPENIPLYITKVDGKEFLDYEKFQQWGMTIDLNSCIGCSSCLVACQSENNIPIVGKEQVINGREMHWIRMDRYFATKDPHAFTTTDSKIDLDALSNPEMIPQPVACQQCEYAPCETVCPVNATIHTEEGLNAMAYNRCIGTRYCANNCPYKARRFNFFDYNKRPLDELYLGPFSTKEKTGVPDSMQLQKNPNVTVRMRGVMEKCTYCVQRLSAAKIKRKEVWKKSGDNKDLRVPDGDVKVACQQACPTDAIKFGDIGDKNSEVFKMKESGRNYDLLKYIGTRPRTSYLARIKNPNMKMPGADQVGSAVKNIH